MNATVDVTAVRRVGPETVALDLRSPAGFDARPGQFVRVRRSVDDEVVVRDYTISSPGVGETFEITVEVDPEGTISRWLADRRPGDGIHVEGPLGNVYYDGEGPVVLLAGGPGIGAAVGIAERARAAGHDATVVYRDGDLVHGDRLAALATGGATVLIASTAFPAAVAAALGHGEVYVFGFRDLVDAASDAIAAAGGDPGEARIEDYGPRDG